MDNLCLNIDPALVDWSRAQFALTAIYHWLFVPLTLGLALIMGIVETCFYRTRKPFWRDAAKFWQRLFGINFAMGVATGIVLEFEFGTNWSNYSWFVGDIFGAPLAVEGIVAFFMESTFVAVMYFGWKKVSAGFHLASTWLTGVGATLSAWWILVANSWMQYPIGCDFNPDSMRNEMTSFFDVALSPYAIDKFCHTVTSAWIIGAVFTVAVSSWYLIKKRHGKLSVESIKIASAVGICASLLAAVSGHHSAQVVGKTQPMKLAAMEALYNGGNEQGLTIISLVNPFRQPDFAREDEPPLKIAVPYGLSILATNSLDGYVAGVNDILNGYTKDDGTREPSFEEKQARGKQAIDALAQYRKTKSEAAKSILMENMKYFGYGYVKERADTVPFIPINFYCFRVMVGMGCLFILFFLVLGYLSWRGSLQRYVDRDGVDKQIRWLLIFSIILVPLAYIASESGWLVAEFGRQPWTIQDMLPTWVSVSQLSTGGVILTFFLFLVLFTTMLAVEINIMLKQIRKGPDTVRET